MTFAVTVSLTPAGITTGLGYSSQRQKAPNRKNQTAAEGGNPSYTEPKDNVAFLHFIVP